MFAVNVQGKSEFVFWVNTLCTVGVRGRLRRTTANVQHVLVRKSEFERFCTGQTQRGQAHESSRRFLTPGKHLADNLREDGLCKVSLTNSEFERFRAQIRYYGRLKG